MTPTEAAVIIRQAMIDSPDTAQVMAVVLDRQGTDLYDWVDANPKLAIMMAEAELLVQEQLAGYARDIEGGALGDRPNNQPAT